MMQSRFFGENAQIIEAADADEMDEVVITNSTNKQ